MKQYPEHIMQYVRQYRDLEKGDTSEDDDILLMSPNEVMDAVLHWKGFIGYGCMIRGWVKDIYDVQLGE